MYLAQSLPFLSKCALENGLPLLLGTAVSKKFKTLHFTPIGSHNVTPDKGRMTHRTLVLIHCSLEIYCRLSDCHLGVYPGLRTSTSIGGYIVWIFASCFWPMPHQFVL